MKQKNKVQGVVYKAQNIQTDETYIGITINSIHQRQLDHTERAVRGEQGKFHQAIGTYGPKAFVWEQIDTATSSNELAEKEKQYILEYNAKEDGYNVDSGGGIKKTVYQYDMESRELIDEFECLEEAANSINTTKQHISRACLSVNQTYGNYHWTYDKQEAFIPKKDNRKKKVIQFSFKGEIIAKFESVAEASRQTGISKTCIRRVCAKERKQTGGFLWKYE